MSNLVIGFLDTSCFSRKTIVYPFSHPNKLGCLGLYWFILSRLVSTSKKVGEIVGDNLFRCSMIIFGWLLYAVVVLRHFLSWGSSHLSLLMWESLSINDLSSAWEQRWRQEATKEVAEQLGLICQRWLSEWLMILDLPCFQPKISRMLVSFLWLETDPTIAVTAVWSLARTKSLDA